ncbi:hypothetical protein C3L33_08936, partial [Rhododendron williamsianum]
MSPESVPSTMPPRSSNQDEIDTNEAEVWSGYNEDDEEVLSGSLEKESDEIGTNVKGNESTENFEVRVEQPKVGMMFDTPDEAYLYYSRYAKENGYGGKARVRTANPVKPRPQTKTDCPARLNFALYPNGKWRLNRVALEHNHEHSLGKSKFYKNNRVLDEHVKRKLILNDKAGIPLHKIMTHFRFKRGGHDNLEYN